MQVKLSFIQLGISELKQVWQDGPPVAEMEVVQVQFTQSNGFIPLACCIIGGGG